MGSVRRLKYGYGQNSGSLVPDLVATGSAMEPLPLRKTGRTSKGWRVR
jgi:hypothetical protein